MVKYLRGIHRTNFHLLNFRRCYKRAKNIIETLKIKFLTKLEFRVFNIFQTYANRYKQKSIYYIKRKIYFGKKKNKKTHTRSKHVIFFNKL